MSALFRDRSEAGQRLAAELARFTGRHPVVLALPRGGVAVAFEVALALQAPLDLVLVRKIGAPFQPELAVGAVADGGTPELVLNEDVSRFVSPDWIRDEMARQIQEMDRRRTVYLGNRPRAPVKGRTAIVVDDGIATGATMRAALHSVRRAQPDRLVLAVPVAPPDTLASLGADVDEVVCLATPEPFGAVGRFYDEFPQLDDAEVIRLMDAAQAGRKEP